MSIGSVKMLKMCAGLKALNFSASSFNSHHANL